MSVFSSILIRYWQSKRQDVKNLLQHLNTLVLSTFVSYLTNNSNSSLNKLKTMKKLTNKFLKSCSATAWFGLLEEQLKNNLERKLITSLETSNQYSHHQTPYMNTTFLKRNEIGRPGKRSFQQPILQLKKIFNSIKFRYPQLTH